MRAVISWNLSVDFFIAVCFEGEEKPAVPVSETDGCAPPERLTNDNSNPFARLDEAAQQVAVFFSSFFDEIAVPVEGDDVDGVGRAFLHPDEIEPFGTAAVEVEGCLAVVVVHVEQFNEAFLAPCAGGFYIKNSLPACDVKLGFAGQTRLFVFPNPRFLVCQSFELRLSGEEAAKVADIGITHLPDGCPFGGAKVPDRVAAWGVFERDGVEGLAKYQTAFRVADYLALQFGLEAGQTGIADSGDFTDMAGRQLGKRHGCLEAQMAEQVQVIHEAGTGEALGFCRPFYEHGFEGLRGQVGEDVTVMGGNGLAGRGNSQVCQTGVGGCHCL
jgi:hypothetical protein